MWTFGAPDERPRTLIVRAAAPKLSTASREMLFNEWSALLHLQHLGDGPQAARCDGGRIEDDTTFVVMEDLGGGPGSPAAVLEGDDAGAPAQAIVDDARTLACLHGLTAGTAVGFRQLRQSWSVFHVIWRVPDALSGDRPRDRRV